MKKITEIAIAIILFFAFGASMSLATTNIDPVDHYAKVLLDGSYIDFGCPLVFPTIVGVDNLPIGPSAMTSSSASTARSSDMASSSDQQTSLTPSAATFTQYTTSSATDATASGCSTVVVSDYMVTGAANGTTAGTITLDPIGGGVFNDRFGNLSGYAWGELTGWINFAPIGGGVTIDGNGYFHGLAWGQNVGWIALNCDATGTCANDPFRVRTSWRPGQVVLVTPTPTPGPAASTAGPTPVTPPSPTPTTPSPTTTPTPGPSAATSPSTPPPASSSPTPTTPIPSPSSSTTIVTPTETPSATTPSTPTTTPTVVPTTNPTSPTPQTTPTPVSPTTPSPTTTPTPGSSQTPSGSVVPPSAAPTVSTQPALADRIMGVIFRGFENLAAFLATVRGDIAFKTIAIAAAAGALLSTPTSVWRSALSVLAFRKRKPWGTVYDSVTKQPLDPAYVVLKDEEGKEINTSITDLDGRYGFLTDAGRFTIVANKTNYTFPSARLAGRAGDELYTDLYFGGPISAATKGDVIIKNIPMDPMTADWNERAKQEQKLLKFYSKRDLIIARITNVLFWFGFALSAFALVVAPRPLNIGIVALYVAVFILKETVLKPKKQGIIADKYGNPMSFAIMRIFSASLNTEIAHKAANALGQYFALVPNGSYYVKIETKNPDGTYTSTFTSQPFEVRKGVIDTNFAI